MVRKPTDAAVERRLLEIVERVLALPESQRGAELEREIGDDGALRERAEAMLRLEGDLGPSPWTGLDLAPAGGAGGEPLDPGARIGSYELVRPIARGGTGRVWLARQENPRREVAVKILERFESAELVRRFRYEADLLARLRHAGIAHVYEAGVLREEGVTGAREVPWIALEYVAGARPLTRFVREEGLGLRATLELFLRILDAVGHAHARGVIHRDLKPANLLVDATGNPKVIDFGIARDDAGGLERTATVEGRLLGTVSYMSPEQAAGEARDVDVRTDVYSLGVVLYELVCGRLPSEGDGPLAVVRAIVEDEPERPSRLVRGLDVDLEAALLRALEKERDRRYSTVSAFEEDLRRLLAGQPVLARTPGAGRRVRLFVRRNRALVAGLSVAALGLVAGAGASLRFGWREAAARAEAERMAAGLFEQSFELLFAFAPGIAALEGGTELRRAMIEEAVQGLETLERVIDDDPERRCRLAEGYAMLGDVLGNPLNDNVGDPVGAARCLARSEEIFRALEEAGQAELVRRPSAALRAQLGQRAVAAGELDRALEHYAAFLAVFDAPGDPRNAEPAARNRVAGVLVNRGSIHGLRGDLAQALEDFERARDLLARLVEAEPGDGRFRLSLCLARSKVGTTRVQLGDAEGLEEVFDAFEELQGLCDGRPTNARYRRYVVDTAALLSTLLLREEDWVEAELVLERGLADVARLRAADPGNRMVARLAGDLTYNRGWLERDRGTDLRARGDARWPAALREARDWLRRSLEIWEAMASAAPLEPRYLGVPARLRREISALDAEIPRSGEE